MSIDDELRMLRQQAWTWTKRCPAPGETRGITPTKFEAGLCDLNYSESGRNIGGGKGVGDSVLFSSILCYSGENWACESVRKSQGNDGRMWRAPQRVERDTEPTFSRDHLLGTMLYMVTMKKRGRAREAVDLGNKLWNWIADKRCREVQKALDAVTEVNLLRDLIRDPRRTLDTIIGGSVPSRYRLCDGEDGYCSISLLPYGHWGRLMLEVWRYVGATTKIQKSVSREVFSIPNPIPGLPDISENVSIPINFSLEEYLISDYNLIFVETTAGGSRSAFLYHLGMVAALLLREMGLSNPKSELAVQTILAANPNPFFLWVAGKSDEAKTMVLDICPRTQPAVRTEWSWERYSNDLPHPWEKSYGFDFIAVINLLLGDIDVPNDEKEIVTDGTSLYYVRKVNGEVWRYNGSDWDRIDQGNNAGKKIAASGGNLYQVHTDGSIWRYNGSNWDIIDIANGAKEIAADGNSLYLVRKDNGEVWRYNGSSWDRIK